ncbi:hypothetical protein ABPG73_012285 [Tetrahymena malaccensis]
MPEIKLDNDVSIQKEKLDLSEQKEEGDYFKNRRYQSRVVKTKLQIDFQQIKQSFKERLTNDHLKSQLINTPRDANTPVNRAKLDKHIHNFKAIQNKQYSQIIYQNIFKTRFRRKEEYLQNQGLSMQSQKFIEEQLVQDLNIFQLYKDILFLKKAIMILLDKQQLAALKLVGCSQQFLDTQMGNIDNMLSSRCSNINSEELEFSEHKEEIQSFNNNKNNYKSQRIKTKWQVDQQNVIQEFENKFKYENLKISTLYSPKETKRLHIKLYSKKNMENLQNLKAMYDLNFSSIVHKNIFKTKCFKKQQYLINQGLDQQTKQFIEDQLVKDMNIFQLYQDILLLKKAIMIILDKQQLSAIKLIGLSQNFLNIQKGNLNRNQIFQCEFELSEYKEENESIQNKKYKSQVIKTKLFVDTQYVKQDLKNQFIYQNLRSSTINSPKEIQQTLKEKVCFNKLVGFSKDFLGIQNQAKEILQQVQTNDKKMSHFEDQFAASISEELKLVEYEPDSTKGQQIVDKKNCKDQKSENEYNEFAEQIQIFKENQYESQQIKTKQQVDLNQIKTDLKYTFFKERLTIQTPRSPQQAFLKKQSFGFNYILQRFQAIFNQKFIQEIHKNIFQTKFRKKQEYLLSQGLDQHTKKFIEEQLIKDLNIFQLYKDILFLKKAIMVLLDKQQLAAIKVMGCSQKFLQFQQNEMQTLLRFQTNEKMASHFEEQYSLWISEDLQYQNIQQFLQKCQNDQNMSEIDRRIFSSIY